MGLTVFLRLRPGPSLAVGAIGVGKRTCPTPFAAFSRPSLFVARQIGAVVRGQGALRRLMPLSPLVIPFYRRLATALRQIAVLKEGQRQNQRDHGKEEGIKSGP